MFDKAASVESRHDMFPTESLTIANCSPDMTPVQCCIECSVCILVE